MAVSRRLKITLVIVVLLAAAVAAGVALGFPALRERVRTSIERRCGAIVAGACHVDRVELARDGLIATRIRATPTVGAAELSVDQVAVSLSWWRALRRATQGVTARVRGVHVRSDGPVEDVVAAIRRARESQPRGGPGSRSGVRVDRVVIEDATADVRFGLLFRVQLEQGHAEWRRDAASRATWRQATFRTGPFTTARTGACTLEQGANTPRAELTCEGFASRVDIDTAGDSATTVRSIVRALFGALVGGGRRASGSRSESTPGTSDSASVDALGLSLQSIRIVARHGHVVFTHGDRTIVELTPASFELDVTQRHVRVAQARFGRQGAGPAILLDLRRPTEGSWQLDLTAEQVPLPEVARWVPVVPWHAIDTGRASVHMRAEPAGSDGMLSVDGELSVEHFGLAHRGLAHDPIDGLDINVRGSALLDPARGHVATEGVNFTLNGITLGVAGWAERRGDRTAVDVALRVPTLSCDAIRRALPAVVTGPVGQMTFTGTLGADVHLALDTTHLDATELDVRVQDLCAVAHDGMTNSVRRFSGPFVQRVQEPAGVRTFVTGPGSAAWVALPDVSPHVVNAVLTREDGRFYRHHGFNIPEIRGAIVRNVGARRFVYGASTITMQLAKNVFLQREKTLVRKLQEVVLTWYLERTMDKDSIVELYLNVVEFGPGIYGIGPAARFFFNREPRDLTPLQSIYLATLLPNPVTRFGTYQRGRVSDDMHTRLRAIARGMAAAGRLSAADLATAQTEVLAFRPPSTHVAGALTQNVDPATTDTTAAAMQSVRSEYGEVANDDGHATGDAPIDGDSDETAEHAVQPTTPEAPINLRVGGRI